MTRLRVLRSVGSLGLVAMLSAAAVRGAAAQQGDPWDHGAPRIARPQLEEVLARYEAASQSPAYSERLRAQARAAADSIRVRLRDGDMRAGDRLRLTVSDQAQLTDTFTVSTGPALVLPVIGSVPLGGVLRSEVEGRIRRSVDSVYRGAVVHLVLLTRVAVIGGVGKPGFYALPGEALVPDAISAAGGLAAEGSLSDVYVERGQDQLWHADSLQVAMREGRTIAELGLQPGDRIVVPMAPKRDPESTVRTVTYLLSLPLSLYALLQLVK